MNTERGCHPAVPFTQPTNPMGSGSFCAVAIKIKLSLPQNAIKRIKRQMSSQKTSGKNLQKLLLLHTVISKDQ